MKRPKLAHGNETSERIERFEHCQASSVCLKVDYSSDFTGIFQNWAIKNSSKLDISQGVVFCFGIKMGDHHARFCEYSPQSVCFQ